ncbi:MAG: hypothetical protein R3F04_13220 [Lysobacteraceae bacterium]
MNWRDFSKQFIGQMASLQNDYLIELEVIGWNGILDFRRIEKDETLAESGAIIQKAKRWWVGILDDPKSCLILQREILAC